MSQLAPVHCLYINQIVRQPANYTFHRDDMCGATILYKLIVLFPGSCLVYDPLNRKGVLAESTVISQETRLGIKTLAS